MAMTRHQDGPGIDFGASGRHEFGAQFFSEAIARTIMHSNPSGDSGYRKNIESTDRGFSDWPAALLNAHYTNRYGFVHEKHNGIQWSSSI
jgi:hypothetical protein